MDRAAELTLQIACFLSVAELRRWMGEYALTWGWTIGAPTDASHAARLFVTKGGRTLSPGRTCGVRPP